MFASVSERVPLPAFIQIWAAFGTMKSRTFGRAAGGDSQFGRDARRALHVQLPVQHARTVSAGCRRVEETGVAAYNGALALINSRPLKGPARALHVEAVTPLTCNCLYVDSFPKAFDDAK
jgi:hypothetical protein